jgi:hypothetical protein
LSGSDFDAEAELRNELALELHHAAKSQEAVGVDLAFARFQHADAVDGRGDGRPEAAAEKKSLQIRRADGETRTPDPIITSDVLYQLSYVGGAPSFAGSQFTPFRRVSRR